MKIHNFSAGPSILPQKVVKKASEAILNLNESGLSLIEISHRSNDFVKIINQARELVLEILDLKDKGYKALFLQGGASMEFLRIPYNFLSENGKACYLDTGTWANNAIKEAKNFGDVIISASSETKNYNYIPKNYTIDSSADYFHCTSNNTIYGTQMNEFPKTNVPVICDMSSDIFSRTVDYSQFGVIYAGAQKNLGPSGVSLIIIKEDLLGKTKRKIPSILNYQVHIEKESMFNTPNTFAIYTCLQTLLWIKENGGIKEIEKRNNEKANHIYNFIDQSKLFYGTCAKEDRSKMNVTFRLHDESLTKTLDTFFNLKGISGIKGHRSVGGYRASIYNAMPLESVVYLIDCLKEFELSH